MSPPCQPFSRNGKRSRPDAPLSNLTDPHLGNQRDDEDPRTKSLLVLLKLFAEVKQPPAYLMLENVSGFQASRTREQVVAALTARDYAFQEVMLSPSDVGVPNSRLRYFLLVRSFS